MSEHQNRDYKVKIIAYKYNKYQQINGSLFYAFEYLIKAIETLIADNVFNPLKLSEYPSLCILGCSSSVKASYLENLNKLFAGKYPHPDNKNRIDMYLNSYMNTIKNSDPDLFMEFTMIKDMFHLQRNLIKKAIDRIKFPTDAEFRRMIESGESIVYASTNTFLSYIDHYPEVLPKDSKVNSCYVFQNRNLLRAKDINTKLAKAYKSDKVIYLSELPQQDVICDFNFNASIRYELKLALDYHINKKILNLFPNKSKFIVVDHKTLSNQDIVYKPTLFCQLDKPRTDSHNSGFFMNTRKIFYTVDKTRWEENVRLIIEARHYQIPIKYIHNKHNVQYRMDEKDSTLNLDNDIDSSDTRRENSIYMYKLRYDDLIISLMTTVKEAPNER